LPGRGKGKREKRTLSPLAPLWEKRTDTPEKGGKRREKFLLPSDRRGKKGEGEKKWIRRPALSASGISEGGTKVMSKKKERA